MPGCVDQVQLVGLAVLCRIDHAHRVRLDGDAALAFEVHGVQDLGLHLTRGERPGQFQQPVGEGGFAVVDMRDNREIADVLDVHEENAVRDGLLTMMRVEETSPTSKLTIANSVSRGHTIRQYEAARDAFGAAANPRSQ